MQQSTNQIKSSDLLKLHQQKSVICILHKQETIVLSTNILKFNKDGKCQERILVLTNEAILNMLKNNNPIKAFMKKFVHFDDKYELKRRIPLTTIYGITITPNRNSNVFLLHVVNDHDYYYKADNNKMFVLEQIAAQFAQVNKKSLPFYFKEELVLLNYCTFKNHLKQKKDLKPKEQPHFLNHQYFVEKDFDDGEYFCDYLGESQQNPSIRPKDFNRVDLHQIKADSKYFVLREEENRSIHITSFMYHPNILKPSFCYFNQRKELLFIPFMPGGSLKNYITKYLPLAKEDILFYLWQLIFILGRLQDEGVIYLGLSLETVYVKQNGYLVLDGLQKIKQLKPKAEENLHFKIEGNPYYFPPELITFEGYSSELVMWKLGICCYYLWSGRFPFQGKNLKELYYNILTKDTEQSQMPDFIKKMLTKDKHKRITFHQLKNHPDLESYNYKTLEQQKIKPPFPVSLANWSGKMPIIYELRPEAEINSKK